ncbi:7588_t:CDS:2 [Entrophospora sp. SA101]|nr:7588_t:CDS:2 [Entrophospora sp. SA101]
MKNFEKSNIIAAPNCGMEIQPTNEEEEKYLKFFKELKSRKKDFNFHNNPHRYAKELLQCLKERFNE